MKYGHVIGAALSHPWAVLDAKFDAIVSVLARCEAGERFSEEQVRAAVGERKMAGGNLPYLIDENGSTFRTLVHTDEDGATTVASCYAAAESGGAKGKLTAVIPVFGILMPRASDFDMSEYGTSIAALRKSFRTALDNGNVKTVLFLFDSPGGSVYHIDEFAQEIFDARDEKKIVSQIDPLSASAAYYLAAQTSEISITPSGEAGSIGVRAMHQDISKALEQRGVKITNISAGKYKTEGNQFEPLSEEGLAFMQQRVNEYYDMFVKAVARGRGVTVAQAKEGFGQGRVFGAKEAKKSGMVDRVSTLDDTLSRLGAGAASSRVPMSAEVPASGGKPVAETQVGDGGQLSIAASGETAEFLSNHPDFLAALQEGLSHPDFAAMLRGAGVNPASAEIPTEAHMSTALTPATAVATSEQVRAAAVIEADRIAKINQLAGIHNLGFKASKWISEGVSVEAVQSEILQSLKPAPIAMAPGETRAYVVSEEHDKLQPGILFGRSLRACGAAKKFGVSLSRAANEFLRDPLLAQKFERGFEATADPQAASTLSSGGFIIPENLMMSVIELLRPKAVIRSLNPTPAPLPNGQLNMPKLTGGATANYMGENKPITPSKVKGGQVKATAKKLAMLVPISNDLLRFASIAADTMVRDDAVRAIAQAEDAAFIRGSGSVYSPKGLLNWALSSQTYAATAVGGSLDLAHVFADLNKAITTLETANVAMDRCGWLLAPRTKGYLFALLNSQGIPVFRDEMLRGTILGYPFRRTTQIPTNLAAPVAGSSEIYFADFSDVVLAEVPTIAVETSIEATYDDGSGNLTSAFSNDQTVLRMIEEHDLVMRHQESIVVINGVTWA